MNSHISSPLQVFMYQNSLFRVNTLLPLGLFITSATFSTIFGNISKEESVQILASIKKFISLRDKNDFTQLVMNPKFIAPTLFLCSAVLSVLNENNNQVKNQILRNQMERMNVLLAQLETQVVSMENKMQKTAEE